MKVKIRKGYDLKLAGGAEKVIAEHRPQKVAYTLSDFPYIKPKVLVKEGDRVQAGTPLFCDKRNPEVIFVSPVSGTVEEIRRGDRRKLLHVVVKIEGEDKVGFQSLDQGSIEGLDANGARTALLERGLWPSLRRRPFHKVAELDDQPKALFVSCLDSNPLAADPNFYLDGRGDDFKAGLTLLSKLCPEIHLCLEGNETPSATFEAVAGAKAHTFAGKHPRGNLSVHLEKISPVVRQDQVIWSIRAQDVVSIGKTLLSGNFDAERVVAWAGPAAKERKYYRTVLGACTSDLPREEGEVRQVSGSVLTGAATGEEGFIGYYDHSLLAIKEDRKRRLLGWLTPGLTSHSLTRCYATAIAPQKEYALTTTTNGEHRAIVDNEMYDRVQPLDIHTSLLYKTMLAGDVEESERMGLWSVAPEDFALASYMDPSKNDFAQPLVEMLDELYKEEG